ncbi:PREDICTED: probable disease resistance protein At4g27220 [Theobroma cacao]|uniref:Probable disease resistance protein At4g27220 n=1 Tax=Theobroma cacao TaxID=3641 RepID=A0AB32WPD9_THECC|nr:PREDICTED: probable disease resistance protein At4g27220 [Theobroma cacao]
MDTKETSPAEFATSVFSNVAANITTNALKKLAGKLGKPIFGFDEIIEDFNAKREQLILAIDKVQNDVNEAERQTEVINHDVEEWLTKARQELKDVQNLSDKIESNKRSKWLSGMSWRSSLSKEVEKKTLDISKLLETCNFSRVGQRPPLQGIEFIVPKDFMRSESSMLAFSGIMEALKSDGVNMIGLHGMPGVGKTTLAEVVGKQATEQKLFDKVVIVTVSQTPNFNKIQDRIAEILHFNFKASTEKGKAEELWRRLKSEKKILIILDDVWKELELQIIGIPFGGEHEGCKILLTTRDQQVCCKMDCEEEFKLNILSEHEAWVLFKDKAGLKDDSPTLNVAKEVAPECGCLPLAIVTVAKALKGESLDAWIAANKRLKSSRHLDNQHVCGGIYTCLELSYDYLDQDNIKQCFLLCALFPEDYEISIELLTICGIGQGLFNNNYFMEDLRREIHLALSKLQKSGLLLEANDKEHIKMHDVVRDFAHWITSRGENIFMVKDWLTEWPMSERFGCYTAISLWNIEINHLPNKVKFSKLKTLFLTGNNSLRVSCAFFERMTTLQVLLLQDVVLALKALQFLTNLRTLCIINCELENISSLRNLENLEIFALLETNIYELPEELVGLHKLKSLYFSYDEGPYCYFPPNLLPRLTSLQELHMTSDNNANLLELNSLTGLTGLALTVSTNQCSQENFVFPKLQSYNIAVSEYYEGIEVLEGLSLRTLRIKDFSSSLNAFKELFCNVEKLTLSKVTMEHKNIVPNVDQRGLKELTSLELVYCENLECLFDTTREQSPTTAFSNLRSLELTSLPALENIWKEPTHHVRLQSLKEVTIHGCDKLKSIFSPCLAQSLLHLETLNISECEKLKQVFAFDKEMVDLEVPLISPFFENQVQPLSNLTYLELTSLPTLKSLWKEPTHHVSLQSLKEVIVYGCDKLKSIFSPCLAQSLLHLEKCEISECEKLKQVFAFDKEMTELEVNQAVPLSNLRRLKLRLLPALESIWKGPAHCAIGLPCLQDFQLVNLINLSSENFLISSPSLEKLKVCNCPKLRNFTIQKEVNEQIQLEELYLSELVNSFQLRISANCNQEYIAVGSHEEVFQVHGRIKELHLEDLSEEQIIWKDVAQVVTLENLTILEVIDCKRLRYIFSPTIARSLSRLVNLEIQNCDELDQIIAEDQVCSSSDDDLQPISFPNLTIISVKYCKKLKHLFPLGSARCLPKLEELKVEGNSKLEQVFELEDEAEATTEKEIKFDQLRELSLKELPSLVDFCPRGYHFVLSALHYFSVKGCPKMTTGFFIDSKTYVHAKTETPQLVEQDAKTIQWGRSFWGFWGELPPYREEL